MSEIKPLREMLEALTGEAPPDYITTQYSSSELTEYEQDKLQWWCVDYVRPVWATGIGLLEAADKMIEEAVSNGNIPPQTEGHR